MNGNSFWMKSGIDCTLAKDCIQATKDAEGRVQDERLQDLRNQGSVHHRNMNLILLEKIAFDCDVRRRLSSGPADPRHPQDGSPSKFCSPLEVVRPRGLGNWTER
jgi:hypothetical protein